MSIRFTLRFGRIGLNRLSQLFPAERIRAANEAIAEIASIVWAVTFGQSSLPKGGPR